MSAVVRPVISRSVQRRPWRRLHGLLGLFAGALFALACITGAVLPFYPAVDVLLNPQFVTSPSAGKRASYQQVFDALRAAEPNRDGPWRIEVPEDPARPYMARYYDPVETRGEGFAPLVLAVDPWRAKVLGRRFWGDYTVTWIYDLHYTLLLGPRGTWVLAAIGLLLALTLVAGVRLWWPLRGRWRAAFAVKIRASGGRAVFDAHRVLGAVSALVLMVLTLTGVALAIPDVVNPVVAQLSAVRDLPAPHSVPGSPGATDIGADRAVAIALRRFPDGRVRWIEAPAGPDGVWRIRLRQPGEPGRRFPKTFVWVDRYAGTVLAAHDPTQAAAGETFIDWLHPLHSGEAFALPGRIVASIAGVAGLVLYVTGLVRWRQRTRAHR